MSELELKELEYDDTPQYFVNGENVSISTYNDVLALKSQLAEKDKEIERLKDKLIASKLLHKHAFQWLMSSNKDLVPADANKVIMEHAEKEFNKLKES